MGACPICGETDLLDLKFPLLSIQSAVGQAFFEARLSLESGRSIGIRDKNRHPGVPQLSDNIAISQVLRQPTEELPIRGLKTARLVRDGRFSEREDEEAKKFLVALGLLYLVFEKI